MIVLAIAAALAGPPAMAPSTPAAATSAVAPAVKPSETEALALVHAYSPSRLRRKSELLILDKNFVPGLRASAEMSAVLDAFPALGPELTKAMASQIDVYMAEFDARFYPRAAAIIRESLSRDDVLALTAFYSSDLGQKMLEMASDNVDGTEIMERAAKDQPVDAGVTTRQAMRAGILTYGKLSASEREEVRKLSVTPAGRNLYAIMPKLSALQSELMNDPGPKFKASSEAALADAFKRVTGIDPANP